MDERSIAWLIRRGRRKVRCRGIARNQIGLAHRCAAINLGRLVNLGLTGTQTGRSHAVRGTHTVTDPRFPKQLF